MVASIAQKLTSVDIDEPVRPLTTAHVSANHCDKPTAQSERVKISVDSHTVAIVLNLLWVFNSNLMNQF